MKYNFDIAIDRRNSSSLKWDVNENELPMWVADMDFQTAPQIISAINNRVAHRVFGYSIVPDSWYKAICNWWNDRHNFCIEKEQLIFCTGVVPAISSIVRKVTTVGEKILVQSPVYNIFYNSIINNGRIVLENKLKYDGEKYEIDFEDLEKKLADSQTTMMILCNPHNPIGKIWSRDNLERIGNLCAKYNVLVVSDEIHCDLVDPGHSYTPFASVSDTCAQNSITCIAPTKAFNIAGLQSAAVMIPNENIRKKVERGLNTDEIAEPNSFAITATIAAFTEGSEWLDALRSYLLENKSIIHQFIQEEIPQLKLVPSEATYLLWIDCKDVCVSSDELNDFIYKNSGLLLSSGSSYGESGNGFIRMNIACSKDRLIDGLIRLKNSMVAYGKGD